MKRVYVVLVVSALVIIMIGVLFWNYLEGISALKHETDRWAVIEDVSGDCIAVETTNDTVWAQLVQLYENKTERFIGSIVEEYNNKWGFRLDPENITIAEFTAEGLQATIRYISENLDYWLDLGWVFVHAKVTEIHGTTS